MCTKRAHYLPMKVAAAAWRMISTMQRSQLKWKLLHSSCKWLTLVLEPPLSFLSVMRNARRCTPQTSGDYTCSGLTQDSNNSCFKNAPLEALFSVIWQALLNPIKCLQQLPLTCKGILRLVPTTLCYMLWSAIEDCERYCAAVISELYTMNS